MCEALRYWVAKEEGQVFSLSSDIGSTVTSRFKQFGKPGLAWQWDAAPLSRNTMEEIQNGSVWNTVSLLLTTDDVVMLRAAAPRWNVGDRYGALEDTFFGLLKMDSSGKLGIMKSKAGVYTQCCDCGFRSWTGSVGLGFILLKRTRYQTN